MSVALQRLAAVADAERRIAAAAAARAGGRYPLADGRGSDGDARPEGRGSEADALERWGWHGPERLAGLFKHDRQARLRWIKGLPPALRRMESDGWCARGDSLLPDGRRLADVLNEGMPRRIPAEVVAGSDKQRVRQLAALELLRRDLALQEARPDLAPGGAAFFAELQRLHGDYALRHGIGISRAAWCGRNGIRARLRAGLPVDGRIRSGRKARDVDQRLVEVVCERYLHQNGLSESECHYEQRRIARELGIAPLTRHQVRKIVASVPRATKVRTRQGVQSFNATCLPKMTIDYSKLGAGEWLSMDGRVADQHVRVPDGRGGWRLTRPFVVGAACVRTGAMEVHVGTSETGEGRLLGLRRWCERRGIPRHVADDNSEAGKRVWGSRRGSEHQRRIAEDRQLGSTLGLLGVELHPALPYQPWTKKIESLWRFLKRHSDQFAVGYWGGKPSERPEEAAELLRTHPESFPTLNEYREHLETALAT